MMWPTSSSSGTRLLTVDPRGKRAGPLLPRLCCGYSRPKNEFGGWSSLNLRRSGRRSRNPCASENAFCSPPGELAAIDVVNPTPRGRRLYCLKPASIASPFAERSWERGPRQRRSRVKCPVSTDRRRRRAARYPSREKEKVGLRRESLQPAPPTHPGRMGLLSLSTHRWRTKPVRRERRSSCSRTPAQADSQTAVQSFRGKKQRRVHQTAGTARRSMARG